MIYLNLIFSLLLDMPNEQLLCYIMTKTSNIWWTNGASCFCINTRIYMELFQTMFRSEFLQSVCVCVGNIKKIQEVGLNFRFWNIIKIRM